MVGGASKRDTRASHHNTATPEDSSIGYQYGGNDRGMAQHPGAASAGGGYQ